MYCRTTQLKMVEKRSQNSKKAALCAALPVPRQSYATSPAHVFLVAEGSWWSFGGRSSVSIDAVSALQEERLEERLWCTEQILARSCHPSLSFALFKKIDVICY